MRKQNMNVGRPCKMRVKETAFAVLKVLTTIVLLCFALLPVYWMLSLSIRQTAEMAGGSISLVPETFTWEHFTRLFGEKNFGVSLTNSAIVTGISLVVSLLFGICCAYILARQRFHFKAKKPLTYWVLLTRILPPITFAVPLYIMFSRMGWLNSLLPEICACIFINIPLIIWFLVSFFQSIPIDLEESAKIDGASEWKLFSRIIVPLILPGIAAVAMLSFIYAWNEYTYGVIFIQNPKNYTVPLSLAILNTEDNVTQYGVVAAGSIVSILPMAVFVIFAQKYLISGLSSGAVKG